MGSAVEVFKIVGSKVKVTQSDDHGNSTAREPLNGYEYVAVRFALSAVSVCQS